ncbi:MAG: DUF4160 domain-containing protein [Pseudanabaenaceae cyanobacterium]|jgi:hypothetical protein
MPTLLTVGPYRLFCYAGDRDEPPHVHIKRDKDEAKFWLDPIRHQSNRGFSRTEINRIQRKDVGEFVDEVQKTCYSRSK